MEVYFTAEQEAQLSQIAIATGKEAKDVVKDAALCLLEEMRFAEAVSRGEAAFERGEYLTHKEVGERIHRLVQS